jgi:hypothetical protein
MEAEENDRKAENIRIKQELSLLFVSNVIKNTRIPVRL